MARSETGNFATILAVDDDRAVLGLLNQVLHEAGYRVLVADGGWNAIREFEGSSQPVELLLTDVIMPDLTGPVLAGSWSRLSWTVLPGAIRSGSIRSLMKRRRVSMWTQCPDRPPADHRDRSALRVHAGHRDHCGHRDRAWRTAPAS